MTIFGDTIAAISTASGTGAIAIVRLSGPDAISIAKRIFRPRFLPRKADEIAIGAGEEPAPSLRSAGINSPTQAEKKDAEEFKSNFALHGFIFDSASEESIDEVVLTPFRAPHTYTGDDLVEISCHGGPVVTNEILSLVLQQGARLARRGEFTERAFLSGKLDLTQAEAVLDVIQAKTTRQGRRALSALAGSLGERIRKVRINLMELLTRIVAGLDFPEEIGDAPEPEIDTVVTQSLEALHDLAKTARTGRYLREGLKIAIIGRPNAGKSSLLNQLLKFERAIVTDIPGTTRDSLEELLDLNGVPVVLIDTAGIRPTEDHVEKIGIERTKKAIAECDLALFVVDLVAGWEQAEVEIQEILAGRPYVLLGNKVDAPDANKNGLQSTAQHHETCAATVNISARTGENISSLTKAIEDFVFSDEGSREGPALNARQAELCLKAEAALKLVHDTLLAGMPQDCLATDLKTAVDALSEISGDSVTEEVITQVFATFCIGK
jgi:tRNA modification GTPase